MDGGFIDPTGVSWAELKAVDWDEQTTAPDLRIHQFKRDERGEWVFHTKTAWSRLPRAKPLSPSEEEAHVSAMMKEIETPQGLPEGQEWEVAGVLYRSVRLRRADAIRAEGGSDWPFVFELMAALASRYGDDGVRLVAWFNV